MSKKKTPSYQIQIIPNDSRSIQTFSIAKWFLRLLIFGGIFTFLAGFILLIYAGDISLQLRETKQMKKHILQLEKENSILKQSLDNITQIQSQHTDMMKMAQIFKIKKRPLDSLSERSVLELVENKEIEKYIQSLKTSYLDSTDANNPIPNIQPVIGIISKAFSKDDNHQGVDIAAMLNDPVYSTAPGIVTYSGWQKDLGKTITIDHGQGYVTRYAHLNKLLAQKGDYVDRGQFIAMIGMTGNTTGPHLHYEVIKDREQVDPEKYFEKDFTHDMNEE